jgi:hypothetical protein
MSTEDASASADAAERRSECTFIEAIFLGVILVDDLS